MYLLKKADDANLCITIMHHSYEWFNWNYKSDLEKTIVDNSEMLLIGHDHCEGISSVSIDNSLDTWISSAGEINFSEFDTKDSFNIIEIDTDTNTFNGYIFNWKPKSNMFYHKLVVKQKALQSNSSQLTPLPSFLQFLKEDTYNSSNDFTKYFVFPKLVTNYKNEYGRYEEVKTIESLREIIEVKKK